MSVLVVVNQSPKDERFRPCACLLLSSFHCLSDLAELMPHLRSGSRVRIYPKNIPVAICWEAICM